VADVDAMLGLHDAQCVLVHEQVVGADIVYLIAVA
jgi:hypothetical protein